MPERERIAYGSVCEDCWVGDTPSYQQMQRYSIGSAGKHIVEDGRRIPVEPIPTKIIGRCE